MRWNVLLTVSLIVLLAIVLFVSNTGLSALLHLFLCASTATILLYISRTRAEYLWIGALGGITFILAPLSPGVESNRFWPDVLCVIVFVAYYKLCVARPRRPVPVSGGHDMRQRAQ